MMRAHLDRTFVKCDDDAEPTRWFWLELALMHSFLIHTKALPETVVVELGGVILRPRSVEMNLDVDEFIPRYRLLVSEVDVIALKLAGVTGFGLEEEG